MPTATIGKWGNASAVRIPQPFCEQVGIGVGDAVSIFVDGRQRIIIEPERSKHTLQERMRAWDGVRYATHEYDWGEPRGEEVW